MKRLVWLCLIASLLILTGGTGASADQGKFYVVCAGPAPDLITLRGQRVVEKADVFLVQEQPGCDAWKELIGNREVWVCQHSIYAMLGVDPAQVKDPGDRELVVKLAEERQTLIDRITAAVKAGRNVVYLNSDDPMVFGNTFFLEMLPESVPTEVVPGVGVLQAATAALQKSPVYGWDTSSAVLTVADGEGCTDRNEELMSLQTSMIFYTVLKDYPEVFKKLKRHYPLETPVAVVCYPGEPVKQRLLRSTVGRCVEEIDLDKIPPDRNLLFVGRFLTSGQARKDGLEGGKRHVIMEESSAATVLPTTVTADGGEKGKGKFYIVGMGVAPDLITQRAVRTLTEADLVIYHDPSAPDIWKKYVEGKEAIYSPRSTSIYLGVDPETLADPESKQLAIKNAASRKELLGRIEQAIASGKSVAVLEGGDPMMYGNIYYVESLSPDVPREVIPGVGAFQAATAAVKRCPNCGWDTSSTIITMADWPGRADTNERLMQFHSSMVVYTMHLDYDLLFEQLGRYYSPETPVAVVCYAGDRKRERVIRSTVTGFLNEVRTRDLPTDLHMLLVGEFLTTGHARKDGLMNVKGLTDSLMPLNTTGAQMR